MVISNKGNVDVIKVAIVISSYHLQSIKYMIDIQHKKK